MAITLPYSFVNGTVADGPQVTANFTALNNAAVTANPDGTVSIAGGLEITPTSGNGLAVKAGEAWVANDLTVYGGTTTWGTATFDGPMMINDGIQVDWGGIDIRGGDINGNSLSVEGGHVWIADDLVVYGGIYSDGGGLHVRYADTNGNGLSCEAGDAWVAENLTVYGVFANPSSLKLKRNVVRWGRGLAEILRLDPVSFEYREPGPAGTYYGLTAEELEEVIPELVEERTTPRAETVKVVNPNGLIFVLLNALKELSGRVAVLEGGRHG